MTFVNQSALLAAGFPARPDFGENITFIVVGFVFVMCVLIALSLVTSAIGAGFVRAEKRKAAQQAAAAPAPVASAPAAKTSSGPFDAHGVPEHIPALIAAAVHVTLKGKRHRIRGVRVAQGGRWAQEGRRDIFSSHRVR
ncbi:OadG family protein [Pelagicoccus sp. SDUM812003]|uniref:OadG family protein n=1 Tax=Pelagicoccus sp. SDUM812003 TaxID=3041267 RepID=UPI00280DBD27|nr:OadG family protein [Pelagicoccus sp. SDUM812003]MDQ8203805.1 OadG family protein [Pelagicoccus sp. SDUM812003]